MNAMKARLTIVVLLSLLASPHRGDEDNECDEDADEADKEDDNALLPRMPPEARSPTLAWPSYKRANLR